jgi:hypothetical protein
MTACVGDGYESNAASNVFPFAARAVEYAVEGPKRSG